MQHAKQQRRPQARIAPNGVARYEHDKVRVAIIGVGNCASAFVQGVHHYRDADPSQQVPGLMHVDLGGYHVSDIEFTAAFDIDRTKVGKDLGRAIWAGQNNTIKFAKVPAKLGVPVHRGMTHDGLGKYLKEKIVKAPGETADIVRILRETHTDVVVSYLPVGSEQATKWYVEQILKAGCGFVNCIPVFIAREDYWEKRFRAAKLPIVGDDIKSQVGATIVHRTLARLFADRGVKMLRTSQLNVGGNMDFYNMLERERLESKKISKTNAVTSIMDHELPAEDVYIGPSDYVPWLTDRKWAHIRVEGQAFGDVPLNVELKLEVWDSPNSAGIVIDAVRCCKLALNHGVGGQLDGPSSYLMKSPLQAAARRPGEGRDRALHRALRRQAGQPSEEAHGDEAKRHGQGGPTHTAGRVSGAGTRFSIAHVTPHPWEEEESEVNTYVRAVTSELSRRGHKVAILAPSRSQERVRASRRALRAARDSVAELFQAGTQGEPNVLAVGEALAVPGGGSSRLRPPLSVPIDVARTVEELLGSVQLDFVHVHEPFAPSVSNAALRHSRSLNVASFHAPTERLLSTLLARRFVETFFGRLDARTASHPQTMQLMERYFPAEYLLLEGAGEGSTWEQVTDELEGLYSSLAARRHETHGVQELRQRLQGRELIDVDLHMHTDHSHDCATPVEVLLASAAEQGLGAIAITDHNEISGALEARKKARAAGVKVIVGEEVKTASQGEVIGLFIEEKIPRGLTLEQTVAEIKRQNGIVYVPHPFDRLHSVPDYEHLLRILDDVDAIEVFNPRVAIGAFNEEAARFAGKYRVVAGAGSDSHVAQGLGSVRIRMRDFDGPDEFLQSLRDADILTRPTSLLYVQALKFLQTRAMPPSARKASRARRVRRATQVQRRK